MAVLTSERKVHPATPGGSWNLNQGAMTHLQRLDALVKELSHHSDPDRLVRAFVRKSNLFHEHEALLTLDNRDLQPPAYRLTRSWLWSENVNPYTQPNRLPIFETGLLGDLLYAGKPQLLHDLDISPDDPCYEHLRGYRSLACAPNYHQGKPIALVVLLHHEPGRFNQQDLETLLLNSNMLGRAVTNLALAQQLEEAYQKLDHEMQKVGAMQRHLLPAELPRIEGLSLGASYVTCSQAGGDYYDVVELPDNQWGLCLADVSGHGVPAAVVMAIIHTLVRTYNSNPPHPRLVLEHINSHLLKVAPEGMFATAFYGIYDVATRNLRYVLAGHPPPRLRRGNRGVVPLTSTPGLPLGVTDCAIWHEKEITLQLGDALLLYTDGLLEGTNAAGEPFGLQRLDNALRLAPLLAGPMVRHVERNYRDFCSGTPDFDDRSILAAVAVP